MFPLFLLVPVNFLFLFFLWLLHFINDLVYCFREGLLFVNFLSFYWSEIYLLHLIPERSYHWICILSWLLGLENIPLSSSFICCWWDISNQSNSYSTIGNFSSLSGCFEDLLAPFGVLYFDYKNLNMDSFLFVFLGILGASWFLQFVFFINSWKNSYNSSSNITSFLLFILFYSNIPSNYIFNILTLSFMSFNCYFIIFFFLSVLYSG